MKFPIFSQRKLESLLPKKPSGTLSSIAQNFIGEKTSQVRSKEIFHYVKTKQKELQIHMY
jgi:hypothetical protein